MLSFLLALVVAGLVPSVVLLIVFRGPPPTSGDLSLTVNTFVEVVTALIATWIMLSRIDHRPWSEVGLQRDAAAPGKLLLGFLIGGGAIALTIAALIALRWLRLEHTGDVLGHPILRLTAILIPAALAEELICRGYILSAIRDALGWTWAVALTSIGFGLMHLGNPGADARSVILVTLAGVFLAAIRIATNSLYAAWAAHFAWNWVMGGIFHAAISGVSFAAPSYRYVDAGPDWATGGQWGPEGGAVAGVAMVAGTLLLWKRVHRSSSSSFVHRHSFIVETKNENEQR